MADGRRLAAASRAPTIDTAFLYRKGKSGRSGKLSWVKGRTSGSKAKLEREAPRGGSGSDGGGAAYGGSRWRGESWRAFGVGIGGVEGVEGVVVVVVLQL